MSELPELPAVMSDVEIWQICKLIVKHETFKNLKSFKTTKNIHFAN